MLNMKKIPTLVIILETIWLGYLSESIDICLPTTPFILRSGVIDRNHVAVHALNQPQSGKLIETTIASDNLDENIYFCILGSFFLFQQLEHTNTSFTCHYRIDISQKHYRRYDPTTAEEGMNNYSTSFPWKVVRNQLSTLE